MFVNLDIGLSELIPSDDDWEVIKVAIDKKVREYCKENNINFEEIDYDYGTSVSVNIFSLSTLDK